MFYDMFLYYPQCNNDTKNKKKRSNHNHNSNLKTAKIQFVVVFHLDFFPSHSAEIYLVYLFLIFFNFMSLLHFLIRHIYY